MRKTKEELNTIKKKLDVDELWSWSKFHKAVEDLYGYYLRYVKKVPEDRNNSIYGVMGGCVHDLLEKYYLGEIKQSDMEDLYKFKANEVEAEGYKFDRNDEEQNYKTSNNYHKSNIHFLNNFTPIQGENIKLEDFLLIKIKDIYIQGYSDFESQSDGKLYITDFKTSSIYKGDKINKEKGQLLLYAYSRIQQGWNIDDIVIRWLFTKYINVKYKKVNTDYDRNIPRNKIVNDLYSVIKYFLEHEKKYNEKETQSFVDNMIETKTLDNMPIEIINSYDGVKVTKKEEVSKPFVNKIKKEILNINVRDEDESDAIIDAMIDNNDFSILPQSIRDKFEFSDCFVEIPFTKENILELINNIYKTIKETQRKKKIYDIKKDDKIWYNEVNEKNEYFYACLSGYSPKLHRPYGEYLDKKKNEKIKQKETIEDLSAMDDILNQLDDII